MDESTRTDTRAALMRAAERLIAERGLGAVSARDIMREAGARNQSALHYHFGGMEALIQEVFVGRYRIIEKTRLAYLQELEGTDAVENIEEVMLTAIRPLFEACLDESGRLYVRFCVQLVTDPRFDVRALIGDAEMKSVALLRDLLLPRLSELPEDTLMARLRSSFAVTALLAVDYAKQIEAGAAPPVERATRDAAAALAGFLQTMPSM